MNKLLLPVLLLGMVAISCNQEPNQVANPKLDKLKLPPGFKAEHLYSPEEHGQGSWVAMTFDNKGRMITSDQYGAIYRVELPAVGDTAKVKVEKLVIGSEADRNADTTTLKIGMGFAQGLLYAFNSLYVMVNHNSDKNFDKNTGLYRLQDTDGDDQFDKITLLKSLAGEPGEHGPHSIVLAPDKKSIYIAAGNHVDVPEFDVYRLPPVWQEDNLFPQIKDPRGHATKREAPGGWIAHIDSLGEKWELVGAGFRNEFDIAFNHAGDLFTYDSDMEWDFGMPWYRPTRICHVTSGSEFGWRTGNGKWTPAYPDNLPAVINIGQGSPTNFMNGSSAKFPGKYRNALFAFDWSFGIIYAIHLTPDGASYTASAEEFLSGSPLPLTDGGIGPDGAMYFLTGGRRLESDLYRITATENVDAAPMAAATVNEANQLRRTLEQYHEPKKGAVDIAWPNLKHEDRFVRYAARIAIEHQPVAEWQDRALNEADPVALTQAMIALARHGKPAVKNKMIQALVKVDFDKLTPPQKIDLARAFEVLIFRLGKPEGDARKQLIAYLDARYPSSSNELDRVLSKVLVYMEAPGSTEKTLALLLNAKDDPQEKTVSASSDLIMRNPQYGLDIARMLSNVPPAQQTYLATVLSEAVEGWTPALHETYFKWFANAFTYKGGMSYIGFIDKARKKALTHTPADRTEYFNALSGAALLTESGNDLADKPQPKGPGRRRSLEEALALVDGTLSGRNFEQGKNMYEATLCSSCHSMRGEGGAVGPDLTQVGTRFSAKDILEHTLDPNKEISDQYAATVFTMKDGSSIVGRLINEEDGKYFVSQNPFMPQSLREVAKADVVSTRRSTVSLMLPGLLGRLNDEEIKDIVAYLVAGGNPDHAVYK
ncbi:MAG: c-type cytochrome [Cyclobacteriaceae bacterium]|nr:c-type cytochrome [Cyclobacteriaceae bacterium]